MGMYSNVFTPIKNWSDDREKSHRVRAVGSLLALNGLMSRELIEWEDSFAKAAPEYHYWRQHYCAADGFKGPSLNLGTDRASIL